ncbi:MAG: hypothetical protein BECKG1743E_GA0114224_102822, partial [Candidatus Kentron sp. G]
MLPNSKNARISVAKITQYLLSVTHPVGKSKARFFRACGYHSGNPEALMRDLLKVARTGQVTQFMHSSHGEKYVVEGILTTPNGTNISHYRKSSGVGRIRLICKACRSISDKV